MPKISYLWYFMKCSYTPPTPFFGANEGINPNFQVIKKEMVKGITSSSQKARVKNHIAEWNKRGQQQQKEEAKFSLEH
jgi:hypothetical protein